MEVKLENIIERLKKEGVEGAQHASEAILNKANQEADSIVRDANKKAEKMIREASQQVEQFQKNSRLALQQAARDSELLLKERLIELFDRIFKRELSEILKPDFLKELILNIIKRWSDHPDAEIIVSEKDKKKLEEHLFAGVKGQLKESITIKTSSEIAHGFRIGLKGENVYYDFTDESIMDMIRMFLNPRLNEILDRKNG